MCPGPVRHKFVLSICKNTNPYKPALMKSITVFFVLCASILSGFAQPVGVTFKGTGVASRIESITATNLSTNESVTLPGTATLQLYFLTRFNGAQAITQVPDDGFVYPNPFAGKSTATLTVSRPQKVFLRVQNLSGQIVAQTEEFIGGGRNDFNLSLSDPGIFIVSMTTDRGTTSTKVICTSAAGTGNSISYSGESSIRTDNGSSELKSENVEYYLNLSYGDIILYRCKSGDYTTILADNPTYAKQYKVWFAECRDAVGRNYPIVRIGSQFWMAENMAWIPKVSSLSQGSETEANYYVYGYSGNNLTEAKASANFSVYGALYNWPAAKKACPAGWRLPSDNDWKVLERFLGLSPEESGYTGQRCTGTVGTKLKEAGTRHWIQTTIDRCNITGFTALPGGFFSMAIDDLDWGMVPGGSDPQNQGSYSNISTCSHFWSATQSDSRSAWTRMIGCTLGGIDRHADNKSQAFSVRYIMNIPIPTGAADLVDDADPQQRP